jgi:hypothetical protein
MYDFLQGNWWLVVFVLLFAVAIRVNLTQYAKIRKAQADNAKAVIVAIERVAAALEKK